MKLHFENSQISEARFQEGFEKLLPYINHLNKVSKESGYNQPESSINLPFDELQVKNIVEIKEKMVTKKLKYFVHVGMGGAILGTEALYDALFGFFDNTELIRFPKMIFLDTCSPELSEKLLKLIGTLESPEEILISVASKSGKTLETVTNLELIKKSHPDIKKRLVVIAMKNSQLWKDSEKEGIELLAHPDVGGRYSVFTPTGLFPLACLDIDIAKLLEGAMKTRKSGLSDNLDENLSAISAIAAFENHNNGKVINDTFVLYPELESLGKWYRQLLGESIGKQGKGIAPTVTVSSSDLHSVWQLYVGGPKNRFINLVNSNASGDQQAIKVMSSINKAVKEILLEKDIPMMEIELTNKKERGLGEFMQFKMIEMMFLGKLFDVNAFDQPDVEGYKSKTKEILSHLK